MKKDKGVIVFDKKGEFKTNDKSLHKALQQHPTNAIIKQAKEAKYGYMIGSKPVSEFKFFVNLRREMRGEKPKTSFYWTDKKVIAAFKLLGIKITTQILNGMKSKLTK